MSSRAERRNMAAIAKKKEEWFKSLNSWQRDFIKEIVEGQREFQVMRYIDTVDAAVSGAVIEKYDFSLDEIFELNVLIGRYLKEIAEAEIELGMERMFFMKKVESEVLIKIEKMINDSKKKADIIKAIRAEYKKDGVTTAEINVAYKKVLEDIKAKEEKELDDKVKYIIGDDSNPVKEDLTEATITIAEAEEKPKFEVLREVVQVVKREVKGAHGIYVVEGGLITAGDNSFNSREAVSKWAEIEREKVRSKIMELTKEIQLLDLKEEETIEVIKEFM